MPHELWFEPFGFCDRTVLRFSKRGTPERGIYTINTDRIEVFHKGQGGYIGQIFFLYGKTQTVIKRFAIPPMTLQSFQESLEQLYMILRPTLLGLDGEIVKPS